jgi:hypothetical protein
VAHPHFNVAYETMLLMLLRFFAHTEESEAEVEHGTHWYDNFKDDRN